MRVFRYAITALMVAAVAAAALTSPGCTFARKVIAKDKLNQGVILYNQGRTNEAARYFQSVTELIPDHPTGWLYYGATLIKQYQVAVGEEKDRKAQEALNAYTKALSLANGDCKTEDNAIAYLAKIYDDMSADETSGKRQEYENKWREWMLKRAESQCATPEVKATAYHSISVRYWTCAYNQSQRYIVKEKTADPFHARNFYHPPDKQKFDDCLAEGLKYNEKAVAINPDNPDFLFYKGLLYRERQKATGNDAQRKQIGDEAEKIAKRAEELTKQKKDQAPKG
jgi:tetratricopeptide (TPR) repeat protein